MLIKFYPYFQDFHTVCGIVNIIGWAITLIIAIYFAFRRNRNHDIDRAVNQALAENGQNQIHLGHNQDHEQQEDVQGNQGNQGNQGRNQNNRHQPRRNQQNIDNAVGAPYYRGY